jgi:hypothetical protein
VRDPRAVRSYVRCPHCAARLANSKALFRQDLRCSQCQARLHVSVNYSRALYFLSLLISLVFLWAVGIRNLWLFVLYLPLGFVILTVMVRIAPYIVRPPLQVGEPGAFVQLDLK